MSNTLRKINVSGFEKNSSLKNQTLIHHDLIIDTFCEILDDPEKIKAADKTYKVYQSFIDLSSSTKDKSVQDTQEIIRYKLALLDLLIKIIQEQSKSEFNGSEEEWKKSRTQFVTSLKKFKAEKRRLELIYPRNQKEFIGNLQWMTENGENKDIEFLEELEQNLSYPTDAAKELIKEAKKSINKRINPQSSPEKSIKKLSEAEKKKNPVRELISTKDTFLIFHYLKGNLKTARTELGDQWQEFVTDSREVAKFLKEEDIRASFGLLQDMISNYNLIEFSGLHLKKQEETIDLFKYYFPQSQIIDETLVRRQPLRQPMGTTILEKILTSLNQAVNSLV